MRTIKGPVNVASKLVVQTNPPQFDTADTARTTAMISRTDMYYQESIAHLIPGITLISHSFVGLNIQRLYTGFSFAFGAVPLSKFNSTTLFGNLMTRVKRHFVLSEIDSSSITGITLNSHFQKVQTFNVFITVSVLLLALNH